MNIIGDEKDNIIQVDGNGTIASDDSENERHEDSNDITEYDTDEEAFPDQEPVNLFIANNNVTPGQPIELDVNLHHDLKSYLPLCLVLNARSVQNKAGSLRELLMRICPDLCLISESWESEQRRLSAVLEHTQYRYISYYRKSKSPGGGCAILFNESRFAVTQPEIEIPNGVEIAWALFVPKSSSATILKVKRIIVGSVYISPKSRYKAETIEHIIQTIHTLRATYMGMKLTLSLVGISTDVISVTY